MDKNKQAIKKLQENKLEDATALFIAYTEEHPEDPVGYINVGNMLSQLNQVKEAERFFLKAIQLDEKAATAYYGLGNLYYQEELYEESEKMLTHAHSLGLKESDLFYLLGTIHLKREEFMLAVPFFQSAVELDRGLDALFGYGLSLAKVNYLDEAREILLEVIEKSNGHADALYNLGVIAVHKGHSKEAHAYFEKALASHPGHTLAKQALAKID